MDIRKFERELTLFNMERPVSFKSNGRNLFGIFHHAEKNSRKVGIIMLNAGFQYRVGPHRIYVKIARRLSQLGFPVLRMDFPGIGDSEGELGAIHFDLYDIEDTISAIDFFTQEGMIEKVVLLGLCAGARNALRTAVVDPRVDSIVLWGLPIVSNLNVDKQSSSNMMSTTAVKDLLRRALSIKSWRKYLSTGGDLAALRIIVRNVFWGLIAGRKKWEDERFIEFFESFNSFLSSERKALFVYGDRDVTSKEEFEDICKKQFHPKRNTCEYYIVPNSVHTFSATEAQRNVIEKTTEWLVRQYDSHYIKAEYGDRKDICYEL